ncbi:MAG TPA: NUDIX hydrolase [Marmoricola sp.]|nr:NUDIX hydrolase [Marmoricola sp.]
MVYTSDYPPFYVTADAVLLARVGGVVHALVIRRGNPPFEGCWALPGGFVDPDEDLQAAAVRELAEETGAQVPQLRQFQAYGAPDRDPRHRTVSVAHLAVLDEPVEVTAGDDAAHAEWKPVDWLLEDGRLAFDHARIIRDAVERAGLAQRPGTCARAADSHDVRR